MKRKLMMLMTTLVVLSVACGALASGYDGAKYYDDYYEHDTSDSAGWVRVSGSTAIRSAPDAGASVMERAKSGSEFEYMGNTQYDSHGVAWYSVYCYGYVGWISSEDSQLQWPTFY